jgi:regulator of protease activity HflC (stomatin/prohibitin superfamily)
MMKLVKISANELGLYFRDGEPRRILKKGSYWFISPLADERVDVVSLRQPWFEHKDLDLIIKSGLLSSDEALVLELKDSERALVWVENRFEKILTPGTYVLWKGVRSVRAETVDARTVQFDHKDMDAILKARGTDACLELFTVAEAHVGLYFLNGDLMGLLKPGRYAFWKNQGQVKLYHKDMREAVLDICGQDIMTADKVTLRVNAVLTYRIKDAVKAVLSTVDVNQALYRDAQLAVRETVGTRELDAFLADKESVVRALEEGMRGKAPEYGLEVVSLGIRDIILPGEMKDLMNRVTEAKKAAEANLITRREEVAAIRSQMNSARMLEDNPMLLRLKELEVLEKVAVSSKMNIILGNEKLYEKVMNLI